jgi:small subunit ribosomal protein S5
VNKYGKKDEPASDIEERVVHVNRCSKVVKGGRRFSFSGLIVAGDRKGRVGYGLGKANEVADAIRKGSDLAKRDMFRVTMKGTTIPHEVVGRYAGAKVLLRPAAPGTGVIAGSGVRAILELAGIRDILAKSLGSNNHLNMVKATVAALQQLRSRDEIMAARAAVAE